MNSLDIIIIISYFVGMILLGLYANKKQKGSEDYYVGGRSMGSLKLAALWMAGWIGGSSTIATSSHGYSMGITGVWYLVAIAAGCIIFAFVLAKPIKYVSQKLNNITFPEMIQSRYDAKSGVMCSLTTILAMIGYTASQFVSGASILHVLTGWNIKGCYIATMVIVVFYVSIGGLLAVTYTDLFQMFLILAGIVVLGVLMSASELAGRGLSLAKDLPAEYFDIGAWGWPTIAALMLSTIMSFFTSMDSFTRCIAAKDARTAKRGTIYAALLALSVGCACTYLGMAGKLLLPDLELPNNTITQLVIMIFPHGIKGIVLVGLLSSIMSTADISILTGSASLTKDIYQRFRNPNASDHTLMRMGIVCSAAVGILGAMLGWFNQDIMNILMITFTINSAGMFLPTLGAFFWKRSCSSGAFASMVSSTVISIIWFIGNACSSLPIFQIDAIWPAFGVSAVLYVVICLRHKQTEKEKKQAEWFCVSFPR